MNRSDLISKRLHNQKLSAPEFQQPVDVVRWMGAVQAQDFNGAKWALALRTRKATNTGVEEAFNRGEILRTHVMRPTWHFVAPEDIRWLLQLTAARVNLRAGPNYRKFELDAAVFKRSNKVTHKGFAGWKTSDACGFEVGTEPCGNRCKRSGAVSSHSLARGTRRRYLQWPSSRQSSLRMRCWKNEYRQPKLSTAMKRWRKSRDGISGVMDQRRCRILFGGLG